MENNNLPLEPQQPQAPATPSASPAAGQSVTPNQTAVVSSDISQSESANQPSPSFNSKNPKKPKSRKLIIIIIVAVIVIAGAAAAFALSKSSHKSAKPSASTTVTTGQEKEAAKKLKADIASMASVIKDDSADTSAELKSQVTTLETSYEDANKQFAIIQKSSLLQKQEVNQKFLAFEAKWKTYKTYVSNSISDYNAILPAITTFIDDAGGEDSSQIDTPAKLNSYLTKLNQSINSSIKELKSAKLILPENKRGVSTLEISFEKLSDEIVLIQKYVAQSNAAALEAELTKFQKNADAMDQALSSVDEESKAHEQKLNPTAELTALQVVLNQ